MREGNRSFGPYEHNRNTRCLKRARRSLIPYAVEHGRFCRSFHEESSIRKQRDGQLIGHVVIKPSINYISIYDSIQLCLDVGDSCVMDRDYWLLIR